MLLTVLLVLAIGASSALVFTNRVELLKLAVILALWAAVVAAFVSVIYRRQSDMDQAKVRDLKLVYDLQLDREISARREYELSVETQLRRELASELRAQAADEVAGLRAELAALRANLEILFDADLSHRPALETDRSRCAGLRRLVGHPETAGRVTGSRIDTEDRDDGRLPHRREPDHRRAGGTASARVRVGAARQSGRRAPQAVGGRASSRRRYAADEPPAADTATAARRRRPGAATAAATAAARRRSPRRTTEIPVAATAQNRPHRRRAQRHRQPSPRRPGSRRRLTGGRLPGRRASSIPAGAPGSNWVGDGGLRTPTTIASADPATAAP